MKESVQGVIWSVAICAVVIAVVFGLLGGLIGLDFVISIAYLASAVFVLCIYASVAIWVFSFNWSESPFLKITCAGVILAVLSYIVYQIFMWDLFYTVFVICIISAAIATVIGVLKTIFANT